MSKVINAFLAGIAVGVLVAPRKGSETRKKLMDGISDAKENINGFIQDTSESLKSGFSSAGNTANEYIQKGKDQVSDFRKEQISDFRKEQSSDFRNS